MPTLALLPDAIMAAYLSVQAPVPVIALLVQ